MSNLSKDTVGAKCCTPQKCNPEPKCAKRDMSEELTLQYFLVFAIAYILLRWAITSKDDQYLGFPVVLWAVLQLVGIWVLYHSILKVYEIVRVCIENMNHDISELFAVRVTNPIMKWFGLNKVDYWAYKGLCVAFILINFAAILASIGALIGLTIFFGPFLLGYYTVEWNKYNPFK
jgi:Na+/citrate or Na+/malate symporter